MQTHHKDSMNTPTPQQHQIVPAAPEYCCPKCMAENFDRVVHLWYVVDERGAHIECSICAYSWRVSR